MNYETHIQPKQTQKAKKVRLSCADENCGGPQSHSPQKKNRPQSPLRLKKRVEFQAIVKEGNRLTGKFFCIGFLKAPGFKFGISASRRYGNAPERNRFKRLIREALRLLPQLPQNIICNISPLKKAKTARLEDIQNEFISLFHQIKESSDHA